MTNIYILLPAYNESGNIGPLLEDLFRLSQDPDFKRAARIRVILVDDGSGDGTSAAAEPFTGRMDLTIVKHDRNLGFGPALRTGFGKALSLRKSDRDRREGDVTVVMDADNTQSPDVIPDMLSKIGEGKDVVVASRYAPGGKEEGVARHRQALSATCNLLLKILFPVRDLKDYTCSYRMVRCSFLERLAEKTSGRFFAEDGFVCASELLLNYRRLGGRFAEVPLTLRYDLKKGPSKMNLFKTIVGYFALVAKMKTDPNGWPGAGAGKRT